MKKLIMKKLLQSLTVLNRQGIFVLFFFGLGICTVFGQTKPVSGTITDNTGMALPGVSVNIKGSPKGTNTDLDGKYIIDASTTDVLVFSYIGYNSQEIPVAGQKTIDVSMAEDVSELTEVVVVGYGTQKKATLTGSVSSLKGQELKSTPVTNVTQGLAGRISGLVVTSNNGEPGYDGATLRIRGTNTFGNSSPLVVVDGVLGRDIERIDPNTIESITVLKDASAAIYGAQAANGVILVTTKRGKDGKPTVSFTHNQGYSKPTELPKLTNAAEYATLLNEYQTNLGRAARYTADEIQKYRDGSDPWLYPNTDWFKATLKPWSEQTNTNININGGSENAKYFVSFSKKTQDGLYRNSATKYKEYNLKANLDLTINKYLDLYVNLTGRMEDRNFPTRSSENIFRMIMRSKPNQPAYWPNGLPGPSVEFGDNPAVIVTNATGYNRDKRYTANSDLGFNFKVPGVEGLSLKGNVSYDKFFRFDKTWRTPWNLYSWDRETYDTNNNPVLIQEQVGYDDPRLSEYMDDNLRIFMNGVLNYNRTFAEDHTVGFTAGAEKIKSSGDNFSAYREGFISTAIDQLFAGGQENINNSGNGFLDTRLNYFGRVNYAYKEKFLAEFVWRYQGSYIFDKSSRYGFFPGVSLGYVMSKEKFWDNIANVISYAKLRASYGETGNDLINNFQYLATYNVNNWLFYNDNRNTANQAIYEGRLPNRGVTWESAKNTDIGIDLQFFNGKLALTADYFHNKRTDILLPNSGVTPLTAGLDGKLPDINLGKFENKGFDFDVNYKNKINDFSYGIGVNGLYAKNKVLFWGEQPGLPDYQVSTGRPFGAALYYQAIGIFKDQAEVDATEAKWDGARPGDIIFKDVNEDGVIDGKDRVMNDKSRTPTFTGGLNLNCAYKGFDLSVLLQGAVGGVFYETTESGEFANYTKDFYDNRWTVENPDASYPRTYNRSDEYWVNQGNTFWLHKTDYIRLKNIELGYTIPNSFTSKYMINNFRLYVNAFNLATYSPDMKNYDPENTSGSGYNYPLIKVVNFGVNLTF